MKKINLALIIAASAIAAQANALSYGPKQDPKYSLMNLNETTSFRPIVQPRPMTTIPNTKPIQQVQTFAPVTKPASIPANAGGYMKKPDPTIPQLNVPQQAQPMMIRAAS